MGSTVPGSQPLMQNAVASLADSLDMIVFFQSDSMVCDMSAISNA
jgi:hypothetical protein